MKAQSGSCGNLYLFYNLGARWERVVNATLQPFYPLETDPIPIVQWF